MNVNYTILAKSLVLDQKLVLKEGQGFMPCYGLFERKLHIQKLLFYNYHFSQKYYVVTYLTFFNVATYMTYRYFSNY